MLLSQYGFAKEEGNWLRYTKRKSMRGLKVALKWMRKTRKPWGCREVYEKTEREAQRSVSVYIRGCHVSLRVIPHGSELSCTCTCKPPHLGDTFLCLACLPSKSLLEKWKLMRFCYMNSWPCHTLVVSIRSCMIMRNIQSSGSRRGKSCRKCLFFSQKA